MKTRLFTLSLLAALAVSCSIQEVDQNSVYYPTDQVFYAQMEVPAGDIETKVYVDDDLMVLWHADDRVSIFNKYTFNQEYRFTGKTGDNSGAFKKVESDDFITGNVLDNVYAIYPYQESTEISNQGVLTVTLPATQAYVKDSFGPGANTMVSCSENNELIFKNLCGYVMLKLYGDNVAVKSISIKGNNDETLAGTATVNAAVDSTPSLKFDSDASKEITLTFDSPVTIGSTEKTATTFWLVVPPTTFSKGFTLTVKDSKNWGFEKTTSSSFKVERNSLARMAALFIEPIAPPVAVESISLNKTELTLTVEESETLIATVHPDDATDKTITWSSSNTSIATVENGLVTGIKEGSTFIWAKAGGKVAMCKVLVQKKPIAVESITLNLTEVELIEGESETLVATVYPEDATDKTVTWSSLNNAIAVVEDGKVVAVKEGFTTITAKAGNEIATCKVTVLKKVIAVESIELNMSEIKLIENESETLIATVKPDDATDKDVIWSSSNKEIATVENGVVSAIKYGKTTITAAVGDKTASCSVLVVKDSPDAVYATYNGGSMSIVNGLIQYGSYLYFGVTNYSSETIKIVSVQLIDGETGNGGNVMSIGADIVPGGSSAWSIKIGLYGIHSPTARFVFTFKGEEYTCEAKYQEMNWPW